MESTLPFASGILRTDIAISRDMLHKCNESFGPVIFAVISYTAYLESVALTFAFETTWQGFIVLMCTSNCKGTQIISHRFAA